MQSDLLNEARDAERQARQRANHESQLRIDALEAGREAQIAMLKKQYEYWFEEKDKQLQEFVQVREEYDRPLVYSLHNLRVLCLGIKHIPSEPRPTAEAI